MQTFRITPLSTPEYNLPQSINWVVAVVITCMMMCFTASSQTLNPETYRSGSGVYVLKVNPSNPDGVGTSTLTLERSGQELWTREHDFTFWQAALTGDGRTVGYSYRNGFNGTTPLGQPKRENLVEVIVLDNDGEIVSRHGHERKQPKIMANPPAPYDPVVSSVMLLEQEDLAVFRINPGYPKREAIWWRYRISTGEHIDTITPDQPVTQEFGYSNIQVESRVPGTPLILTLWHINEFRDRSMFTSARILLLDGEGNEIWKTDFKDVYGDGVDTRQLSRDLARKQFRPIEFGDQAFRYALYRDSETIRYMLRMTPTGWSVEEVGRKEGIDWAYREEKSNAETKQAQFEVVERVRLGLPPKKSMFDSIGQFTIDASGNFGMIQREESLRSFVLVSPQGDVLQKHHLGGKAGEHASEVSWKAGDTWLLYNDGLGAEIPAAWWLDVSTGITSPAANLETGALRETSALPGGGFVAISGSSWPGSNVLTVYESDGTVRWQEALFSPEDLAVTTDGRIAALENITNVIKIFSADGEALTTIELEAALGKEPNYVTGLEPDIDGGLILHDFHGNPPCYRINREGEVTSRFRPVFNDGREFSILGGIHSAPDGSAWTSDGAALLGLNAEGVVETVIGHEPAARPLKEICGFTVGPDNRVYIINRQNASVHVFERDGTPSLLMTPLPTDFKSHSGLGSITVAKNGTVRYFPEQPFVGRNKSAYLCFSSDGTRLGFERFVTGSIREEWIPQPGSDRKWVIGDSAIELHDSDGRVIREIERRPNNDWIGDIQASAVARDGSIAIIAGGALMSRTPLEICTYSSEGDPLLTVPFRHGSMMSRIAFDKPYVISVDGDTLYAADVDNPDAATLKMSLAHLSDRERPYWLVKRTANDREIALLAVDTLEMIYVRLP